MGGEKTKGVLLVAGAGSGMGLDTALHLASRNYIVFGSVLTEPEERAQAAEQSRRGVNVHVLRLDITKEDEVEAAVSTVLNEAGRIDGLVNFAGLPLRGFFEDLTLDEIRHVYEVNVFGMMALVQAVVPHMRKARRGRIILTTSIAGRMPSMSLGGYASSKFAIEGLGEVLRQELALFNIHVTLLEPGLITTPHFTVHRNRARRAVDPSSPYYAWFCQHEKIVDDLLARNSFSTADVASLVERILASPSPRLRYVVGRKAKIVLVLRRYLPGEWFESIYWRYVRKMVTQPREPCTTLSGTTPESSEQNRVPSGLPAE